MAKDVFVIKLKISYSRVKEDKLKMPPEPIKRSKYAEELFKVGAGWSDE